MSNISTPTATPNIPVLDHQVDHILAPSIISAPISPITKCHLDLLGLKYIPVFKDGTLYYVLGREASSICEKYGLLLSRRTLNTANAPSIRVPFTGVHIDDFYTTLTLHQQMVFSLHNIKFVHVEYNGIKIYVYDKAAESVCRRFATSTDPRKVIPISIIHKTSTVKLPEYTDGAIDDAIISYYQLLGVDFVSVEHGGRRLYIPVCYLDLVTGHLHAYV